MKEHTKIQKLIFAALLFALGLVLPFLTMQIRSIGNMFLPMHLPVLLCGLLIGPIHALIIGFLLPLTRSFIFGMPVFYPNAIAMSFEIAALGFFAGFFYVKKSKYKCIFELYKSIIASILISRMFYILMMLILMSFLQNKIAVVAIITRAFIACIPGVIIELTLIPIILLALQKTKIVYFGNFHQ